MYERFNTYSLTRPRLRRTVGGAFVVVGTLGLIAPIIPGAPIFFIGLELLGLRMIFTDRVKRVFKRSQKTEVGTVSPHADS